MMKHLITAGLITVSLPCMAQGIDPVFDKAHFAIVNENGIARLISEYIYNSGVNSTKKNEEAIVKNMAVATWTQRIIENSLTEVNSTLKNSMQVKQITYLAGEILRHGNKAGELARGDPELVLFAESSMRGMYERSLKLFSDISNLVLKGGKETMMNHASRDELIGRIIKELEAMNAIMFSLHQNMYYAKINGFWKTVNPFAGYINKDKAIVEDILHNVKHISR